MVSKTESNKKYRQSLKGKAVKQRWQEENRILVRGYIKKYADSNRDVIKQRNKEYRDRCRERRLKDKERSRVRRQEEFEVINQQRRANYKNDPNRYLEQKRKWTVNNPEKHKYSKSAYHLRTKYGITPEEVERKLIAQHGKCAICGFVFLPESPVRSDRPYQDHDHISGKNRDLLCNLCNAMLGFAKEKKEVLETAIAYLKKHERIEDVGAVEC